MRSTTTEPLARALLLASINCGHEIDSSRVLLHFDAKQEGHNALNQMSRRIEGVLQAQPAAAVPAIRWSPIETAPKDGSVILVDDNAGGSAPWAAAKWLAGEEWSGWIYEDDVMNDNQPLGPNPTRWLEGLDALDASVIVAKEQAPARQQVAESPERLAELKAQLDLALQVNADARCAGRAEALAILLGTSAEDFPEIYIGEHTVGEGDSLSFHWREDALRALLLLTGADPAVALIERVTDAWGHSSCCDAHAAARGVPRRKGACRELVLEPPPAARAVRVARLPLAARESSAVEVIVQSRTTSSTEP